MEDDQSDEPGAETEDDQAMRVNMESWMAMLGLEKSIGFWHTTLGDGRTTVGNQLLGTLDTVNSEYS